MRRRARVLPALTPAWRRAQALAARARLRARGVRFAVRTCACALCALLGLV